MVLSEGACLKGPVSGILLVSQGPCLKQRVSDNYLVSGVLSQGSCLGCAVSRILSQG